VKVKRGWAVLSTGGHSSALVPSLAVGGGGAVVLADQLDNSSAEAVTFTPSLDGVHRDTIASGWSFLDDPVLLSAPDGGIEALLSGSNGTSVASRRSDGSFATPVLATDGEGSQVGGASLLAPDGQPVWPSAQTGQLSVWRSGSQIDLSGLVAGTASIPSLGRDAAGRYWLAWYTESQQSGIEAVQLDPATLQPIGRPATAPASAAPQNDNGRLALACAATCRIVYEQPHGRTVRIVSWAPGAAGVRTIASGNLSPFVTATYAPSGRLWVVWYDNRSLRYAAKLGDASGAGGKAVSLGRPQPGTGYALASVAIGSDLVVVSNWSATNDEFSRSVTVTPSR
jgi:hypothetical protein